MERLRIVFRKGEEVRFLSHLDLMATLEYAVRRARLPVELSKGFNPRPRLSLAAPLPLGYVGEREVLEIVLRESLPPRQILDRLQASVPPGIVILDVEEIAPGQKPAASRLRSADYRIELADEIPSAEEQVADLLSRATLDVEERRDDGVRRRDLRPLLLSLRALDARRLHMTVQLDSGGTVRPEQILALLSMPTDGARITRERIELKD